MSGNRTLVYLLIDGVLTCFAVVVVSVRYARNASRRQAFRDAFGDPRGVAVGAVVAAVLLAQGLADRGNLILAIVPPLVVGAAVAAAVSKWRRRAERLTPDIERET